MRQIRTLVLGLGNPIMGDDGLGLAILDTLRRDWEVDGADLVDGGTWGMNLLPLVEDADRLLLLDAIRLDAPAGTTHELERDQLPRFLAHKLSPHQVDLKEILALADFRGNLPAMCVALGAEPAVIAMGTELSPPVAAQVAPLAARAVEILAGWGHLTAPRIRTLVPHA